MSSKATGSEDSGDHGQQEGGDDDGLLSSLAEELVWRGEDDDYDQEEGEGSDSLDGLDLEQLGIEVMDDENSDEVRAELEREWGRVSVEDEQSDYRVDTAALQATLRDAMQVLGCQAWDVGAVLTTDEEVSRLNSQYRGMDTSTDILSFPMTDMSDNPGVLPKVRFPAEMDLGDMYVSLAYVDRQIARDRQEAEAATRRGTEEDDVENGWWDRERGVSGAMSNSFDVQERASMLLVHGLIHLLGYDHETESDYAAMVEVEEKVIAAVFRDRSIEDPAVAPLKTMPAAAAAKM